MREPVDPTSARGPVSLDREHRYARLAAYLLGTLDDESRQAVREAAIRDDEVAAELREIELDLLDDAARGALSGERLRAVRTLATAPHNRSAWVVAQTLAARPHPDLDVRSARTSGWRHPAFLSLAAALLLAVALANAFLIRQRDEPGGPVVIEPPASMAAPGSASNPGAAHEPAATADAVPPPPAPPRRKTDDNSGVLALYLPATTLRGARPIARMSPAVRTIRLELELDPPLGSPTVTVTLRSAPGASVWTSTRLPVTITDGAETVVTRVPASAVPSGPIEAAVRWTEGPDQGERIFSFIIRRD